MHQVKLNCITVLPRLCLRQKKYSKKRREKYNDTAWGSNGPIFSSFPTNTKCDNIEQLQVERSEKLPTELYEKFFDDEFYLFLALLINLSILYLDKIIGTDLFAVYLK